ncbi:MAG: hypothetical protein P9M15_00255 [Candidatus Electryoneaceae bacterium]|nr:hypothetical protein [Candidatus Electryoneaceae bacterium]
MLFVGGWTFFINYREAHEEHEEKIGFSLNCVGNNRFTEVPDDPVHGVCLHGI